MKSNILMMAIAALLSVCFAANAQTEIRTAEQLRAINNDTALLRLDYKLMSDITVDNWTPIGSGGSNFNGTFDGNGHTVTIRNIGNVPLTWKHYPAGLFGVVGSKGKVKNLRVEGNISFTAPDNINYSGGIAGYLSGHIENCTSNAIVMAGGETESTYAGGIAGMSWGGTIRNCYSTGSVFARGNSNGAKAVGGIVGLNTQNGVIQNCYVAGDAKAEGKNGLKYAGGIVGVESKGLNGQSLIEKCTVLDVSLSSTGGGSNSAGGMFGGTSGNAKTGNNYVCSSIKFTGKKVADTGTSVALAATNVQNWWERNYAFGATGDNPWAWSATDNRPVLYWETGKPVQDASPSVKQTVTTVTTGQVRHGNDIYTVSVGSVTTNQQGTIHVEILTEESIKYPLSFDGAIKMPITAKIVTGNKTLIPDGDLEGARNSVTFPFKSTEIPEKVIVYGNDGNDHTGIAFDITKDMVKTEPKPQPVQPAMQQTQPVAQPVARQTPTETQQVQPAAQQTQPVVQKTQPDVSFIDVSTKKMKVDNQFKKWYLETGLSIYIMVPDGGDVATFAGLILNGGVYTSPNSRLSLDMSFNFHSKDIGTFTYTKSGSSKEYTDGKITRDYVAIPILFTWNYVFDLGPVFKLRLGPSAGFTSLSVSDTYTPVVDNAPDSDSEGTAMLSVGGGFGATWNIKRFFIDTGYKFIWNSEAEFEGYYLKANAHQVTLTLGWRF